MRVVPELDAPSHTRALAHADVPLLAAVAAAGGEAAVAAAEAGEPRSGPAGEGEGEGEEAPYARLPPARLVALCNGADDCGANRSYAGKGGSLRAVAAFPEWETRLDGALGEADTSQVRGWLWVRVGVWVWLRVAHRPEGGGRRAARRRAGRSGTAGGRRKR